MTSQPLDVLCVADMCVDLVLSGNVRPRFHQVEQIIGDYVLEIGGSASIFATQFARLGGHAGVIGWVGQDVLGTFLLDKLRALRLDVSRVRTSGSLKTGLGVALAEPLDRAILTYSGTIDAVRPEELSADLLTCCRHWHVASYFLLSNLRTHWLEWLKQCKQNGVTTSLDTNWDPEERWKGVIELLPYVDVFLPNETEALALAKETDIENAGRKLANYGPLVVVKRSRDGARAFQPDRTFEIRGTDPPHGIVDAIGAGDVFDAGFIRAWLLGKTVPECLNLAQHCAVASLAFAGGIAGQLCTPIEQETMN